MQILHNYLGETGTQALLIGLMLVVFYFLMLRPKQKEAKSRESFLEGLKKGSPIITIGGIHGKVVSISEDSLTIETDKKGSQLTISKQAISKEVPTAK